MRLTLPDPSRPTHSLAYDYPDAPFVGFLTWLTAIPLWQRPPNAVSQRVTDLLVTLGDLRASGAATPVRAGDPPIEIRARAAFGVQNTLTPSVDETPGQARARRMREGKARKRAEARAG